ncbi:DUF3311 domain-containing protein [Streptomyces sp. TR06-5]|uniref:DUF3311 domain-containing protein n=1 Tax=unclassified Streptomyces TaxID=2593676 RepID=UPI0039A1C4E3
MPPPPSARNVPTLTPARAGAAVCLFVPFVAMLWVGSYDRVEPTFIGLPFFYWYQMLWVPLATALTCTAYVLVRRDNAARAAARSAERGDEA